MIDIFETLIEIGLTMFLVFGCAIIIFTSMIIGFCYFGFLGGLFLLFSSYVLLVKYCILPLMDYIQN